MKRFIVGFLALLLAVVPTAVFAQSAAPGATVTQSGSTGLAATTCLNNIGTSSVAITLTIPAPGGNNSVYIDYLVLTVDSTAAVIPGTSLLSWSSTNIAGTPNFPFNRVVATSANAVAVGASGSLPIPIKGLVGVGPTFVSPTANTNFFGTATVCWHVAP